MFPTLFGFAIAFPFLIVPWGSDPYYAGPKSTYLQLIALVLWIIYAFRIFRGRSRLFPLTKSELLLAGFAALTVVAYLLSIDRILSLYGARDRYEGIASLLSYFSLCFFCGRFVPADKIPLFLRSFVISGTVACIYGILQHFFLDFLPRSSDKIGYDSSYSFFDNPNFFGTFTVIMLLLSLLFFFRTCRLRGNLLFYVTCAVIFCSMIYANTRSAWLGFIAGWLVLTIYIFGWRRSLLGKWAIASLTFAALFLTINFASGGDRYVSRAGSIVSDTGAALVHSSGSAGSSRYYIWKKALPFVPHYFWHGSGPDTFGRVFPRVPTELKRYFGSPDILVDKAHNEYLQMAITLGVPALLLYLLYVGSVLRNGSLALAKQSDERRLLQIGLLAVIAGYLIQAFFNISVVTVAPFYWMVLGLAAGLTKLSTTSPSD